MLFEPPDALELVHGHPSDIGDQNEEGFENF